LDIALSHPWIEEAIKRSATNDGYAASLREERKISKYNDIKLHGNLTSPNFTLLVFKHFG
jgi:hypothetical protein